MLNLTSIILLFVFWVSAQAQQWELIDFGQGLNPNDEVVCSEHGIKEPIPGELYALVYNSVGNSTAIAKSTDGGQTWTKTWFPSNLTGVVNFVINPLSPNEWYVLRGSSNNTTSQYLVYKSDDFGQTWNPYGQGLLNPPQSPAIGSVSFVEFDIDYSTGTLVGILEEEGWDWVDYYATERSVNASGWTNALFATSFINIWPVSGKLRADREETPNVFTIGGDKKYQNFPAYYDYKIVTTNNDSFYVSQISAIDNSDLMYANTFYSIYKNEFGWSNGNWELVNWSINGIPVTEFEYIWGNGNGFLLIYLDNAININGQDYFIFYSNDNGNTWQIFFNVLPNGIVLTYAPNNISYSHKLFASIYISGVRVFYQYNLNYLITGLKESKNFVETFSLSQNYPNPFNPTTSINYQFPVNNKGKVVIFNTLGQRIKEFELRDSKGNIFWNGTDEIGNPVSSGVYFYQLKTDKLTQTKSMTLIK